MRGLYSYGCAYKNVRLLLNAALDIGLTRYYCTLYTICVAYESCETAAPCQGGKQVYDKY